LLLQKIMKSSLSGRSSQATNRNGSSMALWKSIKIDLDKR
jgi:hypothetical protein